MSSALPQAVKYHGWLMELTRPWLRGQALEAGFGYGQYTPYFARHTERLVAVDCDPVCVERLRAQLPEVEARVADLTDPEFALRVGRAVFDVIICLNVLEHIQDDAQTLAQFREALRPGGRLLLIVPAHPALYGSMDAMAGHFRRYTRSELRRRLIAAGYRIRRLRYINPVGGLGWWANAKLFKPRDLSAPMVNRQILWYDRYVQPLSRLVTPLTAPFFGQSVWVVAEGLGDFPSGGA
ncbi:MAG: class I SAM-dependent methyltransferase [Planctomycetes bacterium]|nr:class I SAM-dependent methyltransferase [Planctomycetota bacterium]